MCNLRKSAPLRGHQAPQSEVTSSVASSTAESLTPAKYSIIVLAPGLPSFLELPPELTFASVSEALTTIRHVCPYGDPRYEGHFDPQLTPDFKTASEPLFFKNLPTRIRNYISTGPTTVFTAVIPPDTTPNLVA